MKVELTIDRIEEIQEGLEKVKDKIMEAQVAMDELELARLRVQAKMNQP